MSDELSPTARALLTAARGAADPRPEDLARVRASLRDALARGDATPVRNVPPANTAAALLRAALLRGLLVVGAGLAAGGAGPVLRATSVAAPRVVAVAPSGGGNDVALDDRARPVSSERRAEPVVQIRNALLQSRTHPRRSTPSPRRAAHAPSRVRLLAQAARPASDATTVVSDTPSAAMTNALALYDQRRFAEAAVQLERVVEGATGDGPSQLEHAQFLLGASLFELGFHASSLAVFGEIASRGTEHPYRAATLPWLARLAAVSPEPMVVAREVGRYDAPELAPLDAPSTREAYDLLAYLMGRARYEDARLGEAVALFRRVGTGSRWYVPARFFEATAHVRLHHAQPAVDALRGVLAAIARGTPVEDPARMTDLAWLELARVYYSSRHYASAIDAWNRIHPESEYWLDALFEEAWAYYLTNDPERALGNIHTLDSPYFADRSSPEALILRSVIHFSRCRYGDAQAALVRFDARWGALRPALAALVGSAGDDDHVFALLREVRAGRFPASVPARVRPLVAQALSDRTLLRHVAYDEALEDEARAFRAMPASFRESAVGMRILQENAVGRTYAMAAAADLARERWQRTADELADLSNQATAIQIEVLSEQRGELAQQAGGERPGGAERPTRTVAVDQWEEGLLWPFNGEYWEDELGTYRQTAPSRCTR